MDQEKMRKASDVLKSGGVLCVATDTVWGLSCDAADVAAVARVKKMKGRNDDQPFIILVSNDAMLERYVNDVPDVAWDILDHAERPITIVYPCGIKLPSSSFHSDGSVAIRVTKDPVLSKLIQYLKRPVISTSANLSGKAAPKNLNEISAVILESVDYVLDLPNSKTRGGKPSSILKIGLRGEIEIIRK